MNSDQLINRDELRVAMLGGRNGSGSSWVVGHFVLDRDIPLAVWSER
jgi:hypothetical protein